MGQYTEMAPRIQKFIDANSELKAGLAETQHARLALASQKVFANSCVHCTEASHNTLRIVCQVFFWDLIRWLPHDPLTGKPDQDQLVSVCGQSVLHLSCCCWSTRAPCILVDD